jgi:hypothetical protein
MSITYQIEPVVEVVRAFIDLQLTTLDAEQPLPLLSAITQYSFDDTLCPLMVLDPAQTSADWSRFASGDVQLSLELHLHEIRLRSGASLTEETVAMNLLCQLATAFASDYRLDGNVQNVLVESIALAPPDTLHRLGIPADEHAVFAAATMKLKVIWIESCFAAA